MSTPGDRLPLWHHLNSDSFGFMLFLATLAHGALLFTLSFTLPPVEPPQQTLDVTLAQYPQSHPPEQADFIAQHHQRGSGTAERAATPATTEVAPLATTRAQTQAAQHTPTPAAAPARAAPPANGRPSEQSGHQSSSTRPQVARETPSATATNQRRDSAHQSTPSAPQPSSSTSLLARSLEMASIQAQLDLTREERAKQPRVLRLTSAATRAHPYADYLDNWRRRVETVGNLNYPEQARRQGLEGTLRLLVALAPDGRVVDIKILASSGYRVLDDAAIRIVQLASPFQSFPVEMRKHVDRLEIIRTWKFEKQARVY